MKILIFGAGIIGKIYASKLFECGVDVTLLARRENYKTIEHYGIAITDLLTKESTSFKVPVIKEVNNSDQFDLIIVTVRRDQLNTINRALKNLTSSTTIMFMLNHIRDIDKLQQQYPDHDIILGFPGVGGASKNNVIEYIQIHQQKTTLGCLAGGSSNLVLKIQHMLSKAGFPTTIEEHMIWWLKTHAVFITCISSAITKQNGNNKVLGNNRKAVGEMIDSVKEGFKALQQLGIKISPANLKTIFLTMPKWFSAWYWSRALKGNLGTLAIAPHLKTAKPEMQSLAKDVLELVQTSSIQTPTLNNLLTEFIDHDKDIAYH